MAPTTWLPRTNFDTPRQWLLANGEIVSEPALEQTATGRKVRVAGTDVSAYSRDMDDLIRRAVQERASQKQTHAWMPLHNAADDLNVTAGFKPVETKAELYLLKKELPARTIVWWRFRHPTLPIEALLYVNAGRVTGWQADSPHEVKTYLAAPDTAPSHRMSADAVNNQDGAFSAQTSRLGGQAYTTAVEFIRDNPPTSWTPKGLLDRYTFGSERLMVEALLKKVRACDELESIQIPDLRDPDNPAWLELELYDTNVNANFVSDLTEYLEGTPTVTEALRIYKELQDCLRGIGLVLEDKTENDFQKGLLGNEPAGVTVEVGHPREEDHEQDHTHTVRMHLPTGTFIVDCGLRVDYNQIADRWDEAKTIASLSGEEDTLLAFAREAAKRGQDERARRIIKERKGSK